MPVMHSDDMIVTLVRQSSYAVRWRSRGDQRQRPLMTWQDGKCDNCGWSVGGHALKRVGVKDLCESCQRLLSSPSTPRPARTGPPLGPIRGVGIAGGAFVKVILFWAAMFILFLVIVVIVF
jgi:hypothetical protein